ncbi:hypothetical protein LPJ53_005843 [Coemansia erecta]|uniref:Chitin-binding type-4 domain-containing protein n=1 Tax=Coemansia erecta TaxID=147472 RepID=A0A9W7XVE2_9FUNG|nr:hypothetical protein LPJ53_005843 [Coemansia erecta]
MNKRIAPASRWWLAAALLAQLWAGVHAHVEMKEPPPRHSQFSKFYVDNDDVDYNMKSPLGPIVGYPCRNFKAGPTQGTLVAGHPFRVQFDGVANHLGGDCQFAVSYNNGTTFAVLWDKPSSCFLDTVNGGYDVPVPDHIPAATKAVFAWSWINAMGSREYYMNCADVRIENFGRQEPLVAHELLVVNLPGRPTLSPRTGREEDRLPQMMQQRAFVTVGKPIDLVAADEAAGHPRSSEGDTDTSEAPEPGEPDPVANRAESGADDSTLPDEITSYVFTTHTVTEEDSDDDGANLDHGFSYSELDDYRSRTKPATGLVISDDGYLGTRRKPLGVDAPIPFDFDDTLPLATPHMTPNDNFDIWPASSASTLVAVDISAAAAAAPSASMATLFKTVTISNTPYLQVVVSSNNTAIPSSLTIAY